jgi:uridine kinase
MQDPFLLNNRNLIKNLGSLCTYSSVLEASYDVDTSTAVMQTVDYQVLVVQGTLTQRESDSPNLINKKAVVFHILPDPRFEPKVKDHITYDSIQYEVKSTGKQRGLLGTTAGYRLICM